MPIKFNGLEITTVYCASVRNCRAFCKIQKTGTSGNTPKLNFYKKFYDRVLYMCTVFLNVTQSLRSYCAMSCAQTHCFLRYNYAVKKFNRFSQTDQTIWCLRAQIHIVGY